MGIEADHPAWISPFPALREITDPAWLQAARAVRAVTLPAGRRLFTCHDRCTGFFLLTDGTARVQKSANNDHGIVLYRLGPGQLCELTASSLLTGTPYAADAIAETDLALVTLSKLRFRRLMSDSPQFRAFVFSGLGKAVEELASLVEQLAFDPLDKRLARCLLALAGPDDRIEGTHKALATELGSAREAVSRLLERFGRAGLLRLHRGRIDIADRAGLEALAGDNGRVT